MFWVIVLLSLLLYLLLDVTYYIRGILLTLYVGIRKLKVPPAGLLDENVFKVICLTTDMDFNWHMNNARYLREADFGRYKWFLETNVWNTITTGGGNAVTSASTIRYRKSIELFDIFYIRSRVVCWDDKAFYMEQRFERQSDHFVCAIALIKMSLIRITPQSVVDKHVGEGTVSPPMPEEIQKWVESNQVSSDKLKAL